MSAAEYPKEHRTGIDAIPKDIQSRMTQLQRNALAQLRGSGWSITFVRRPLYQDQVIVLVDSSGEQHAVLQEDGSIIRNMRLKHR